MERSFILLNMNEEKIKNLKGFINSILINEDKDMSKLKFDITYIQDYKQVILYISINNLKKIEKFIK